MAWPEPEPGHPLLPEHLHLPAPESEPEPELGRLGGAWGTYWLYHIRSPLPGEKIRGWWSLMELGTISTIDFPVTGITDPCRFKRRLRQWSLIPSRSRRATPLQYSHWAGKRLDANKTIWGVAGWRPHNQWVFLPPKQLGSVRSKEFGSQLFGSVWFSGSLRVSDVIFGFS